MQHSDVFKESASSTRNVEQTKQDAHSSHSTSKAACIWPSGTWTKPYQIAKIPFAMPSPTKIQMLKDLGYHH